MGLNTVIGGKLGESRSGPSEDAVLPDHPTVEVPVLSPTEDPEISLMEPSACFDGKESIHGLNSLILHEKPGGGQRVQRSDSQDSSSESWGPSRVMHRHHSDFKGFDRVASVLGGGGGGPPTSARVPRGDEAGVLDGGGSDGKGAPAGHTAAVDGQVAINLTDYIEVFHLLSSEVHRQRLIAAGRKAKLMWFLRFVIDGVVLTCLENAVDLSNGARFGTIFLVYILIFACGVAVSCIRAELLEDAPFTSNHVFDLILALIKIIYLVSLRGLHEMGISSGTKYATFYIVFKCVFSVFIKLISALATLKCLNDKLNLAIHQD